MAYTAFFKPQNIYRSLGIRNATNDLVNEIYGVYGGYGLITGLLLLYSLFDTTFAVYIQLIVGLSLNGMALGRIRGFAMAKNHSGKYPKIYFTVELILGTVSLLSWLYFN